MFPRKKPTARDIIETSLNRAEDIHGEPTGRQQIIFTKRILKAGQARANQLPGDEPLLVDPEEWEWASQWPIRNRASTACINLGREAST